MAVFIVARKAEDSLKALFGAAQRFQGFFRCCWFNETVPRSLTVAVLLSLTAPLLPAENLTIDLANAFARSQQYGAQIESANIVAALAREDYVQAKAATLPSVNGINEFLYTQGNGTPTGVFVANNGVHVYSEQLQAHEEVLALARRGEVRMAAAAVAVARARADVAARGLKFTVVQDYYAIVVAQRRVGNGERSLAEARQFFDITQKQERGGEAAHADVVKAELQLRQRERELGDAQLGVQKAKIALAVLIFPALPADYAVVDDLSQLATLPALEDAVTQARSGSPDIRAAQAGVNEARLGVSVARYGYLPSLGLDVFYGINANQFGAYTDFPPPEARLRNLGYSAQATLNIPLWNWGATHSKVKQASLRRQQAELDLTMTRKQLEADFASAYREAQTALAQVDSLRSSSDLSTESLRLTLLRYQAGEATALEVVDAQSTASLSRLAYDDGLSRYRIALAAVQGLMGVL